MAKTEWMPWAMQSVPKTELTDMHIQKPDKVYFGICNSANRGYIKQKALTPIFLCKLPDSRRRRKVHDL